MNHKNKITNQAYQAMLDKYGKCEVEKIMSRSREVFTGFVKNDEVICFLVARYMGLLVQPPKTKSKYIPASSIIQIAQIDDIPIGNYVSIKGKIITIFDDQTKISMNITDLTQTVRCSLFDDSMIKFRNKGFKIGDIIKIKSVVIREYRGRKELKGNEYSSIIKLKNNSE
jgi:hypothetical protein